METLQEMLKVMMALDYLHERAQERQREQLLAGATQTGSSKLVGLVRQMMGWGLMELGLGLSGMGKRLLAEAR